MAEPVTNEELMAQLLEMERLAHARQQELLAVLAKHFAAAVDKPGYYESIVRKMRGAPDGEPG